MQMRASDGSGSAVQEQDRFPNLAFASHASSSFTGDNSVVTEAA
jgi:hypothetical protein